MFRKLIAITLLFALLVNVIVPVSASDITASNSQSFSVMDLERFLTLTDQGTIYFDVAAATLAGYPLASIVAIDEHIAMMNTLATQNGLYIDESFTLKLSMRSLPADNDRIPGINHVEIYWFGLTEVYIDSEITSDLLENAKKISNTISAVDVILTINNYAAFTPYAAQLNALVSTVSTVSAIQVWQIENAASHGTGIIMSTYNDGTTAVPLISYGPQ